MLRSVAVAALISVLLAWPASAAAEDAPAPPSVSLTKTVYAGDDGGASCGSATSFAEAGPDDTVTYCFQVTNTGGTHLTDLSLGDAHVSSPITLDSADSTPLAPGHSAYYHVVGTPPPDDADGLIDETFTNVATVTAIPSSADGAPLTGDARLAASAEAIVFPPEVPPAPGLRLSTTAYAGRDGGQGCPAADLTPIETGAAITYCYQVTNIGNTHLASIAVDHIDSEGSPILLRADGDPLAPDQSAYYQLETAAPPLQAGSLVATATVTANPVDDGGADLTGVDDAQAEDGTELVPVATTDAAPAAATTPESTAPPTPPEAEAEAAVAQGSAGSPGEAPAQSTPAAEVQATEAPAANQVSTTEAPDQLAFTGWETWIMGIGGIGLVAGGIALVQESAARRRQVPATVPVEGSLDDRPRPLP